MANPNAFGFLPIAVAAILAFEYTYHRPRQSKLGQTVIGCVVILLVLQTIAGNLPLSAATWGSRSRQLLLVVPLAVVWACESRTAASLERRWPLWLLAGFITLLGAAARPIASDGVMWAILRGATVRTTDEAIAAN